MMVALVTINAAILLVVLYGVGAVLDKLFELKQVLDGIFEHAERAAKMAEWK